MRGGAANVSTKFTVLLYARGAAIEAVILKAFATVKQEGEGYPVVTCQERRKQELAARCAKQVSTIYNAIVSLKLGRRRNHLINSELLLPHRWRRASMRSENKRGEPLLREATDGHEKARSSWSLEDS